MFSIKAYHAYAVSFFCTLLFPVAMMSESEVTMDNPLSPDIRGSSGAQASSGAQGSQSAARRGSPGMTNILSPSPQAQVNKTICDIKGMAVYFIQT